MSDYIWENPETAYQEHKACAAQIEFLATHGFIAEANAFGAETAYASRCDNGDGPVFAMAAIALEFLQNEPFRNAVQQDFEKKDDI